MTIEELTKKDNNFNSSIFVSKANNMVKKLYNAVTLDEIDEVSHFANKEIINKFKNMIDSAKANGERLIFDQVNVSTEIKDIDVSIDYYQIACLVTCRYCKYNLDSNGKIVSGSNTDRSTVIHKVLFQKKIINSNNGVYRCLGCGTSIDVNNNGICPNCGRVFDLDEFDYYIESFE